MKVFNFFKNLFSKGTENQVTKTDIFGDNIGRFEYVYPVVYKDVKRRGYITIDAYANGIGFNDITDDQMKKGVVRARKFISCMWAKKIKESKRKGFYHIMCSEKELKANCQ